MFNTNTTDTFTDKNGVTIPYSEVFVGISRSVDVFAATKGYTLTVEDKEDIFDDAAYKAVLHSADYDSTISNPGTWGGKIAWHCACDMLAKQLNKPTVSFSELEWTDEDGDVRYCSDVETYRCHDYEADKPLITRETMNRVAEVQEDFNDRTRRIIALSEDGLKPAKISEQLGCTPGAVSIVLCKARKQMNSKLNEE